MSALMTWNEKQLALIRRTVAKDCDPAEFDQFIHICRAVRLDPLRRQIYAFVFNKADPKKRQMTIVTSIGGYRSIAERTGNYRPGPTEIVIDESLVDPNTNPKGISHAVATIYKHSHGEWHPVQETAYWEEFAPLKEVWADGAPSGKFSLDSKKDGWRRMPRVMIEKCAEAKALRRAWPDDFAALMTEEEVDRSHTLDLTATELADAGEQKQRLEMIGGPNALTVDWCDGGELQRVPSGKFGDEVLAFIDKSRDEPLSVLAFADRNRVTLQEYWALDKAGALELKKVLEPFEALRPAAEAAE
jgi:phage recombination protein Bet